MQLSHVLFIPVAKINDFPTHYNNSNDSSFIKPTHPLFAQAASQNYP